MRESIKTTRFKLAALERFIEKTTKTPNTFDYDGVAYRFTIDKFYLDDEEVYAKDIINQPNTLKRLVEGGFCVIQKV